ncbi:hypothetical protein NCCP2716_25190 [Sporosarcina sp. NCCP-2716]|uniref:DUF58 domain-containing protein n=1 Tax=Sporosarcina sp. NCCP-2716 TaxID=2943679 RepID=UPI00203DF1B0|nr:DUF58 domain-containing protein [Sporosarcina sp. NCCP-2716]GKV70021.1 hypothetical protein NCCP2716_25190 [Sporosarcina sp. NCCP-2716]
MMRSRTVLAVRTLFVLLLVLGAYAFAMFQGGMASWTIFYFLLPFALYSLCILLYPLKSLSVTRSMSRSLIGIGEAAEVTLTVKRPGWFPLLYLLILETDGEQAGGVSKGRAARLAVPGFKREFDLHYELTGVQRGEHSFPPVRIETADFFGWMKKTAAVEAAGISSFLVLPETTAVDYVPIGSNHEKGAADSPFSLIKETTVATSVRDYQSGDRVSWIHWKSFARTQNLMTKEFENKRGEHAALLLDARDSATFEEQIRFAASILKEASARRADLTFAVTDAAHPVIRTVSSGAELHHALTQLARLHPIGGEATKPPDYSTALQGGGAVILISGNPDAAVLRPILKAAKMQPVYCFVIRGTSGELPEAVADQVRAARRLGVHVQLLGTDEFEHSFREVAQP